MKKINLPGASILRQKAEDHLKGKTSRTNSLLSTANTFRLIHELEVHQIELEMQNHELTLAKEQAAIAAEKYRELYDLSPTGYFTLSPTGKILQLNLSGAIMMGKEQSKLTNNLFQEYLTEDSKPLFSQFLHKVFNSTVKENCELVFLYRDNSPMDIYLTGILAENGDQCLVTAIDITRRKKAEMDFRKSNDINETLLRTIPFGINIVDENGNILYISDGFKKHLGADYLGKKCWELYCVNHKQCDNCPLLAGIKIGLTGAHETHDVLGGKIFHISHTGMIFNGQKALLAIFIDITERKMAEAALKEKEIQYQNLANSGRSLIWTSGKDKLCNYFNESWLRFTGRTLEQELGNGWTEGIHPEDYNLCLETFTSAFDKHQSFEMEYRMMHASGQYHWILDLGTPNYNSAGEFMGYIGNCFDITERKQAEVTLLKKDSLLNITGHSAKVGGWELDVKTMKQTWTDEIYILHEVDFSFDPTLSNGLNFYAPSSRPIIEKALQRTIEFGEPFDLVLEFITNKGNNIWIHSIGEAYRVNGTTEKVFGSFQDITESKLAEKELIVAKEHAEQSDNLKSAFLANMSHEIRTPMNGILGFASLLKEPGLTSEEQQEYLKVIEKSGDRMLNIINDIVNISKIESGLVEVMIGEVNINAQIEFVRTFLKPMADVKGIAFSCKSSLPSKESIILTDSEKVYGILTNLVKNAIKFTEIGSIEFGYDLVETLHQKPLKEPLLQFYVKDTGVGVPIDRQSAIFERFIQADIHDVNAKQGAGLGLSIANAYVKMLGGEMWLESQKGKGSTFYFTLPYIKESEEKNAVKGIEIQSGDKTEICLNGKGINILIVEDDETSSELLLKIVESYCRKISQVQTGMEAVEVCQNNPDLDLILMDIKMIDMDGYEATRQIRKFNPTVIIIAQTAYALTLDREKALAAGCNDYISKPVSRKLLNELIQKYFNQLLQ